VTAEIRVATTEMRLISAHLETVQEELGLVDLMILDHASLVDLIERYTPGTQECAAPEDPWGNPYFVVLCAANYAIASAGPDGVLQLADDAKTYSCEPAGVYHSLRNMETDSDDLLLFSGRMYRHPLGGVAQLQKRTTSDMRTIAIGYGAYLDIEGAPKLADGWHPAEDLRSLLEPEYILSGRMPAKDAWGNPIYLWKEGSRFLLVSLGCDGVPEVPFAELGDPLVELGSPMQFLLPTRDIVWVQDAFVRFPLGQAPN
jgi:hypothetical protein